MKKFIIQHIAIISAAFLLFGCEKVVQVDLNNAAPQIVIQGEINNTAGPYYVAISKSVPFDSSNFNFRPSVTGAVVKITDVTAGVTDVLTEVYVGVYKTNNIIGTEGNTYQLLVQAEGKEYTASSTMPANVQLDSISFYTNTFFGMTITNPVPNYRDPSGRENYYLFSETVNRQPLRGLFVFDDRLSDGRYISTQLFNDSNYIKQNDTVEVEMRCIEKPVFNYFNQVIEAQGRGNSGPVATPSNPVSNISNGALGYFSAHTVQRKKSVFK